MHSVRIEHSKMATELEGARETLEVTKRSLEAERRLRRDADAADEARESLARANEAALQRARKVAEQTVEYLGDLRQLFTVDLHCLGCLGPITEARLLAPCGHSVCERCVEAMEGAARRCVLGSDKFCPVCRNAQAAAGTRLASIPAHASPVEYAR